MSNVNCTTTSVVYHVFLHQNCCVYLGAAWAVDVSAPCIASPPQDWLSISCVQLGARSSYCNYLPRATAGRGSSFTTFLSLSFRLMAIVPHACPPTPPSALRTLLHRFCIHFLRRKKAAPQASHGTLLGLLLPLYASALTLNLPTLCATIGQALLLTARSSAAAFKEAVAYVGAGERQALEGAVRAAIVGRGASAAAGGGSGRGGAGSRVSGRKLDLSRYSARG